MKPYLTIGMLVISNIFMTFAWYGQLHLRGQRWFDTLPQLLVIVFCWSIAFFEYIFLVPANRIGHTTLSLGQLKIMQEVIALSVFVPFSIFYMKETLSWNYLYAAICIAGAVFFIFRG